MSASIPTVLTEDALSKAGVPEKSGGVVVVVDVVAMVVVVVASVVGVTLAGGTVPTVASLSSSPPHAATVKAKQSAIVTLVRRDRDIRLIAPEYVNFRERSKRHAR